MTMNDGHPYKDDLGAAERIWNRYVRNRLGESYRGVLRDGSDARKPARVDRISIVDDGPGGPPHEHDIFLVVLEGRRMIWSRRYDVLTKMLVRHEKIEESRQNAAWKNVKRAALWSHTLEWDIEDSILDRELPIRLLGG